MQELLDKPKAGIAIYDEFRSQLAQLGKENASLVFDYESPKGNKEARSHIFKLRQTKTAVDKARETEKSASLAYGRKVDAEAKEIIAEIEGMIEVHATPIKAIEDREALRINIIRARIEVMRLAPTVEMSLSRDAIRDRLNEIKAEAIDDSFGEFAVEAAQVKDEAVRLMEKRLAETEKKEAEALELARLREEAAERARKDREEQIRREAEQKAVAEAERKAKEEKEASERREQALKNQAAREVARQREATENAEREKVEAQQRAERIAKETEERICRETEEEKRKEKAATAKREADKKHKAKINNDALNALVKETGISDTNAKNVIAAIAKGLVPNVSISY